MVHWTGHKSRCNRGLETALSPKQQAIEELVAEIGSAFLCARFGITKKVRTQSISYIENWLDGLGWCDYIGYLEQAAMLANRASNYIYVPKRDDI
jgi:antirestriction protein ArdC